MEVTIRKFIHADLAVLKRIYSESIRHLGHQWYTDEQVRVWANFSEEPVAFRSWIADVDTFVAMDGQQTPVGFAGLEDHRLISSVFVSPEVMRRGVGSTLLLYLLTEIKLKGYHEVTTKASAFSKPLFEKFGFKVKGIEHVERKGVVFNRYAMELIL